MTSVNKIMKLPDDSELGITDLFIKKKIERNLKYQIDLNKHKLNLYFPKNMKARALKFKGNMKKNRNDKEADNNTLKMFSKALGSDNRRQKLDINCAGCSEVSDVGLDYLCKKIRKLTALQTLSLDFSRCSRITNAGLLSLKKNLKPLASLKTISFNFSWCRELSSEGLSFLGKGVKKLHSLQSFSFVFSGLWFASQGICIIGQSLKDLVCVQSLNLNFHS